MKKSYILVCLLMAIIGCESEGVNAGRPIIQSDDTEENNTLNLEVSTFTGSVLGYEDGPRIDAKFDYPYSIAFDEQGSLIIVDVNNDKIRKISPDGIVSTLAGGSEGFADGQGANAQFYNPHGMAIDGQGNIFIVDRGNHKIRKITPEGIVTTFAGSTRGYEDGPGISAKFRFPYSIAFDKEGNAYVTDNYPESVIRKITPDGMVSTFAGSTRGYEDGPSTEAKFDNLGGIVVDQQDNIYVTDINNNVIRKITPDGMVSTFAGSTEGYEDGNLTDAKFDHPYSINLDEQGNFYIGDSDNHKIRKITPDGIVSTLAGNIEGFADGSKLEAKFAYPRELTIDTNGDVYVADGGNHRIRKITQE